MDTRPEDLVSAFLSEYRGSGVYLRDHIARVTSLAVSEDRPGAEAATKAIFTSLVEPLADSFEPAAVALYNRAFAQIIQACRASTQGEALDRELDKFGLASEQDLVDRAEKLRHVSRFAASPDVKRVIVLSRITLGADVTITSVIIERMKLVFPKAEIVLIGGGKLDELFGGDARLRSKEISYRRTASTIERLLAWLDLLACVRELTGDAKPGECLVIDPDTRLTQLGLLPVASRETSAAEYIFFPSREYGSGTSLRLSELTSRWLDESFGEGARTYPSVSLRKEDIETARRLVRGMRGSNGRHVVTINFGVGENSLKRADGDFEASLIARLIEDGVRVVLDKGAGEDEHTRADALVARLTGGEVLGTSVQAFEMNERNIAGALNSELDSEVMVWNGRIGMLAALIGESDLYIGYDSAGGHIASALGVPSIVVFAGFSSARMLARWRPSGRAETRVIPVIEGVGPAELLESVTRHAREILKELTGEN